MHKIESDIAEGEILQKEDTVVESPVRPIINRDLKHMDFNLTKQNIAHKI